MPNSPFTSSDPPPHVPSADSSQQPDDRQHDTEVDVSGQANPLLAICAPLRVDVTTIDGHRAYDQINPINPTLSA